MKAIRAKMIMETANFRKPTSFLLHETFPLPPFSTVIGMIHTACGFREYHDMKICVQGTDDGVYTDYCTMYTFFPKKCEKGRAYDGGVYTDENGNTTGIYRTPMHTEIISNPEIIIYVVPDEADFETVYNGLRDPAHFLALGRHDDIVNMLSVETVDLDDLVDKSDDDSDDEDLLLAEMDMYIPIEGIYGQGEAKGTIYTLHKEYTVEDGIRIWKDSYDVAVLSKGSFVSEYKGKCDYKSYNGKLVCLF